MKPEMKTKTPKKDEDYVILYAEKTKLDASLFKQQKVFIESQYKSSQSLLRNMFGSGEEYKRNARAYLKKLGLISPVKSN